MANSLTLSMDYDGIIKLDHFNFNRVVSERKFLPILFYELGCEDPCKIIREYEEAAKILHTENPELLLAKLSLFETVNVYRVHYLKISSVPVIKLLRSVGGAKEVEDYNGPYDAQAMIDCFKRLSPPFPAIINSTDDANKFIQHKTVIVGVFPELSGKDYVNFIVAAEKLKWDYDFCVTLDAKHLPLGESPVSGSVVRMFIPFDDGFVDTQDFNVDAIVRFVKERSTPLITDCGHHPQQLIDYILADKKNDKVMLFINASCKGADNYHLMYSEVAKKYRGQGLIFMVCDFQASQTLSKYFGHLASTHPLIVVKNARGGDYMRRAIEADELDTWVNDYKAGKIARFGISERTPVEYNELVKVVVANTYWGIVMESEENVLLGLYRPEFGNCCSKFHSVLIEVAKHFKDKNDDDIIIAKLDVSVNDVLSENRYDVRIKKDRPTFCLIPSDGGYMSTYSPDDFTAQVIIDYINNCRYNPSKERRTTTEEGMVSSSTSHMDSSSTEDVDYVDCPAQGMISSSTSHMDSSSAEDVDYVPAHELN